jgi:hypothetical protein
MYEAAKVERARKKTVEGSEHVTVSLQEEKALSGGSLN